MWRRAALAAVLVLLQLPVLAVLVVGWIVFGALYQVSVLSSRLISRVSARRTARSLPKPGSSVKAVALVIALLAVAGLWLFSHLHPGQFGTCHIVPLQFGRHPAARECDAFGTTDFIIPVVLIVVVAFLGSDGDIRLTVPGFGTFERTRAGKRAAKELKEEAPELDRRLQEFSQALNPPGSSGSERKG